MIYEFAYLTIKDGQSADFEQAFKQASTIISQMEGFISLNLYRKHEMAGQYLLQVAWQDIAAHRDGFRQSPQYQQWRALLHHFYDPFPVVEYFDKLIEQ